MLKVITYNILNLIIILLFISTSALGQKYIISTIPGLVDHDYPTAEKDTIITSKYHAFVSAYNDHGNIYFVSRLTNRVWEFTRSGETQLIAGIGLKGFAGDGGLAIRAELNYPSGVTLDRKGNIYIADTYNNCIRMINSEGIISTIAGNGIKGFSGDGGEAESAELNHPIAVTADTTNCLYIVDAGNNKIRKLTPISQLAQTKNITSNKVIVFPNPGTGVFTFRIAKTENIACIRIYNFCGDEIIHKYLTNEMTIANTAIQIDIHTQAKGIYFYYLLNKDGTKISTGKLIVK